MRKSFVRLNLLLVLVLVTGLGACATLGLKPLADRTPQDKAITFMELYNAQYADTMAMATNPDITDAQRVVVRAKKEVLQKVRPLIEMYVTLAVEGNTPSPVLEMEIIKYLNDLTRSV